MMIMTLVTIVVAAQSVEDAGAKYNEGMNFIKRKHIVVP